MTTSRIGFPRVLRRNLKVADQDFLKKIKTKLSDAQEFRRTTRETAWKSNEKRYLGEQWPYLGDDRTAEAIVVNKIFSTISTIVPFIAEGDIEFLAEAQSGTANSSSAKLISLWLNRMWRTNKFDGQRHTTKAAWDALVYGDGFLSAAYDIKVQVIRGPDGKALARSDTRVAEFLLENVSPWDVWMDRYATGLWDARWYFRRFLVPVEVARADPRYYFRDDIATMDTVDSFEDGRFYRMNRREGEEAMAVLFEYYDADTEQLIVFSETSELPHMWLDHVARNLTQLPNHPIPNLPYHMSEVEQINALQDELNKTRTQMLTFRKRNVPKIVYDKNSFDAVALSALQSSIVYAGVPVDAASGSIKDLFEIIGPPPMPEDVYNVAAVISGDMDEITGVNEYLRGQMSEIRRTATEASIIEGSSNTKIRHKLAVVERAIREVGQCFLELAAEVLPTTETRELELYLTGEEAVAALIAGGQDIYDEAGQINDALLVPVPQLFQGKYEVFVQAGSSELRNPAVKEQKMHKLVTTLVASYPLLVQAGVYVDLTKALRLWLEALGITDTNSILSSPQAMAMAEQQMVAQMMLGQSGGMAGPGAGMGGGQEDMIGQPNAAGAAPPQALPAPSNSGMIPPEGEAAASY